eukprot:199592-Pleurochrysis_carterae.AAC.1
MDKGSLKRYLPYLSTVRLAPTSLPLCAALLFRSLGHSPTHLAHAPHTPHNPRPVPIRSRLSTHRAPATNRPCDDI